MNPTAGFFTVATGDEHYYRIAWQLLRSYRRFTADPKPFCIVCDRENTYTADFDRVILLPDPTGSYLDKLRLYDCLPFDTGIFIDADCLAYGDLNVLFSCFEQADDFSCFGRVLPLDDRTGWFNYEDLGELQSRVHYCVGLHGGIYFLRKGPAAGAVFDTARQIAADYSRYRFKGKFATPGDEPILALSMALNNCRPIAQDPRMICCYWEHADAMYLSIPRGKARSRSTGDTILVHWGTRYTRSLIYRRQTEMLDLLEEGASGLRIAVRSFGYSLAILAEKGLHLLKRIPGKLKRILHLP